MAQQNTTAYILLGLLSHEPASGYDLKKKIDLMISQFWEVGYGQLYPTLRTLEQQGDITGEETPSQKGPARTVYTITPAGRQKLADWLALPGEKESVRYEILLKLFFGSLSAPGQNIARIAAFRDRQTQGLALMEAFKSNLGRVLGDSPDHLYYYLTVLFGEQIYKAYLAWADEALKLLAEHPTPDSPAGPETETR